jgi:hypothetical protein
VKCVTRQRPKIERGACPRLISRFIEQEPEFLYGPSDRVLTVAQQTSAIPYDIAGVDLSHVHALCTFDAFLGNCELRGRALQVLVSSHLWLRARPIRARFNARMTQGFSEREIATIARFLNTILDRF